MADGLERQGITSPCAAGDDTRVVTMLLRVTPNMAAGGTVLQLTLQHLPNGDPDSYDPDQLCSGTALGADCLLLTQPVSVTVSSTRLLAGYNLRRKLDFRIPYAYLAYVGVSSSTRSPSNLVGGFQCDTGLDSGFVSGYFSPVTNPSQLFSTGSDSVCPPSISGVTYATGSCSTSSSQAGCYYTLGAQATSMRECTKIWCQPTQAGTAPKVSAGYVFETLEPMCDLHEIDQTARPIMNIKVEVGLEASAYVEAGVTRVIRLSTERFETVGVANGIYARLVDFSTGMGLVANNLPGAIITCTSCDQPSSTEDECILLEALSPIGTREGTAPSCPADQLFDFGTQRLENLDDLQLPLQKYVEDNPDTHCSYPSASCRAVAGGCPKNALWYYVRPELLSMYGVGCSQNGMLPPKFYTKPSNRDVVLTQCAALAGIITDVEPPIRTGYSSWDWVGVECLPGYEQTRSVPGQQTSVTPCLVEQIWAAQMQKDRDTQASTDTVDWLPDTYSRLTPNFALQGNTLLTEPLSAQSSVAGATLQLVFAGVFDSITVSFASGQFVNDHMNCAGIIGGGTGELLFSVQNNGATTGTYEVDAVIQVLNDGVNINTVDPTGTNYYNLTTPSSALSFVGGSSVTLQAQAGQTAASAIAFTFSGAQTDTLLALLTLSAPITGAPAVLQSSVLQCDLELGTSIASTLQGVSQNLAYALGDDPANYFSTEDGSIGFWGVIELILIAIFLILLSICCCLECCVVLQKARVRRIKGQIKSSATKK